MPDDAMITLISHDHSTTEDIAPRTFAAQASLEQAVDSPWDTWLRTEHGIWKSLSPDHQNDALTAGLEHDSDWQDQLERTTAKRRTSSFALTPGFRAVIATLPVDSSARRAAAVLAVPSEEHGYVLRLAEMALTLDRQREEMDQLRDENREFAEQLTWDFESNKQLLVGMVQSLASAVEAKDAYTCGHSERVALYSKRIAEAIGFDRDAVERIYLTGLLHDVGKIGVSDAVLCKPGELTETEFDEIRRHPDHGWAILCELKQLAYVLPGVLHHHEQYDGLGYPDGLKGEQIPLDARILAVADAFDAMTSNRAYRDGLPHERAVEIIRQGAGQHWDPMVVEAFLNVFDDILQIRAGYRQTERPIRRGSELG